MKRGFRLSRPADFKRVRRLGKSYTHPLFMLIVLPNELGKVRVAISANRRIGGAVQRNRAKRVLRAGALPLLDKIKPGKDIVLIAKPEIRAATAQDAENALAKVLGQAAIIERN